MDETGACDLRKKGLAVVGELGLEIEGTCVL